MRETHHPHPSGSGVGAKGLARDRVGVLSGALIGVSTVAPAYTLTATIGLIAASVGLKMPAIFIAGCVPMFLTAYAYRELNNAVPDCGASFTWSARAFGPYVGWMCGWGMVAATIIVLSSLASVAVEFGYLFLGRLFGDPAITALADDRFVNVLSTVALIALATAVGYRGVTVTQRLQAVLVIFQLTVLALFVVAAFVQISTGRAADAVPFDPDWFNPFTGLTTVAFVAGVTGSIFAFWGWDTCLTLNEESRDPERTPGRAGLLCVAAILLTYLLVTVAAMMYAGVGESGLGLSNPDTADNVFAALAGPVLGGPGGMLLFLAVVASSVASLQTTLLPAARTMLSMGSHGAFPRSLADTHPRYHVPSRAVVVAGATTAAFYTVTMYLSERVLYDMVASLGILICFYYGITAFACAWFFRRSWRGARDVVFRLLFPVLGGLMLLGVFGVSVYDSMDPAYGSGSSVGGVGLVFVMACGILALGAVLMVVMRVRNPAFFRDGVTPTDPAPEPERTSEPV
ncbi:APC family permease [Nocardiopsis sp. N85]|uniref:APC family permease n=1 Tax=Nocardiopsis sp. N85 TaxID=3029400 RepID=UPI00237F16A9|nr:APC family permease [Nocardiopsis sp. N85]MDE3724642.1 APC family permease [Nocardiopsis sp. N85]